MLRDKRCRMDFQLISIALLSGRLIWRVGVGGGIGFDG
jgi:hypothetical protein